MSWFDQNQNQPWATCSLTQAGLVRVISNPVIDAAAPTQAEAIALLKLSTESNTHHQFWSDTHPLTAISPSLRDRIRGHNQVTDAYLLALTIHNDGRFVTFDRGVESLAPKGSPEHDVLLILKP
jgi:toxin-antitoxin system PIN domain toxin